MSFVPLFDKLCGVVWRPTLLGWRPLPLEANASRLEAIAHYFPVSRVKWSEDTVCCHRGAAPVSAGRAGKMVDLQCSSPDLKEPSVQEHN